MRVDHCFRWNYNFTSFTHWFSFQSLSIIGFKFPGFPVLDFEMLNGIFRINFHGPKNWNAIDESLNSSCLAVFKKTLTNLFIDRCYLFLFHVHATFFWKCVCVCVCVRARVCVCVCVCVCPTDPFQYYKSTIFLLRLHVQPRQALMGFSDVLYLT